MINRFAGTRTVLNHRVESLGGMDITGRITGMAVAMGLGIWMASCGSIGEILWTGIGVFSLPWGFGLGWA